jgi:hypothetical protein
MSSTLTKYAYAGKQFFFRARFFFFFFGTTGVSHCGLAIYIKKDLKAKEELWKVKYFTMHKYNLQKIL